jgi:hypothetical protein
MSLQSDGTLISTNHGNASTNGSIVKVALQETLSTELNSLWTTDDLLQIKSIVLTDALGGGHFISADVSGMVRLLNTSGAGIVLFQTSMGRFVLDGTQLLPADDFEGGILSNITASDIMNGRLGAPSKREHQDLLLTQPVVTLSLSR